jgi:hypothetical protein
MSALEFAHVNQLVLNCGLSKPGTTMRVLSSHHRGRWGSGGSSPARGFSSLGGNSGGGERASSGTRRAVNWAVLCATEGTQSRYSASGHCCRAQCAASAGRQKPHGRLHVRKLWRRPDACGREPCPKPHHSLHRMRRVQFNGHGPSLVRPFQSACFSLDVPPRGQPDQVRLVREWN